VTQAESARRTLFLRFYSARDAILDAAGKARAGQFDRMTSQQKQIHRDLMGLSSGTLATLSKYSDYATLDLIQEDLLSVHALIHDSKRLRPDSWVDVWNVYSRNRRL